MHLGNLLCALVAYLSVKSVGGTFVVRIEDLDTVRCPRSAGEKILDILSSFGIRSDVPVVWQSDRGELYRRKLSVLDGLGLIYPCFCTRAQLHAAEAPRLNDGGVVYAGTCRDLSAERRAELELVRAPCTRVIVPDEDVRFVDGIWGECEQNLARECGDFIVRRSDGVFAYQLAVAVDDGEAGVTEVVRGDDLLSSTARQIYLMRLLGYTPPKYYHIPLVVDSDGRKLSKSEGDRISERLRRMPKERILGGLAYAAGLIDSDRAADLSELVSVFSFDKIRRGVIRLPALLS